jgi:predicted Zn-dependent protease with MMP-like domain
VPREAWESADSEAPFRASSLAAEGFVHLTHATDDLVDVANRFYAGDAGDHLVLTIDLRRLRAPWRYDGDERFPHVYGPLDRAAITDVRPILRDRAGRFLSMDGAAMPSDPIDAIFDEVIGRVLRDLPDAFVGRLDSVAIVVEDEATPEQLASVRAPGLFGLYQGIPRTRWGADNAAVPSKITLFRGPLVRAHRGSDRLARAVEDTLLHEIAHHFGIDDARLHELRRR